MDWTGAVETRVTAYRVQSSALPSTSMPQRKEADTCMHTQDFIQYPFFQKNRSSPAIHECPSIFFLYLSICRTMLPENTARVGCGRAHGRGRINIGVEPGDNTGFNQPLPHRLPAARTSGLDLSLWPPFWGARRAAVNLRVANKITKGACCMFPTVLSHKCCKEEKM